MRVIETALPGVLRIRPQVFSDDRGLFLETWNREEFDALIGRSVSFVQDNSCRSHRCVLRGLHLQVPPAAQAKLIRVASGRIFDVAVDLRQDAPTRLLWTGAVLDAESREMMWIPEGFAHGFLVLSEFAEVAYKTTDYYRPECERVVRWDDPKVGVVWPLEEAERPILSPRDAAAPLL